MSEEPLGSQPTACLTLIQDTEPDHHIRQLDNSPKRLKKKVLNVGVLTSSGSWKAPQTSDTTEKKVFIFISDLGNLHDPFSSVFLWHIWGYVRLVYFAFYFYRWLEISGLHHLLSILFSEIRDVLYCFVLSGFVCQHPDQCHTNEVLFMNESDFFTGY